MSSFGARFQFFLVLSLVGCAGPTAHDKYDDAVRRLERAQAQLDKLRPAYDAARVTAANAVCKELSGTTLEESEYAALDALGGIVKPGAVPIDASGNAETDAAKNKKNPGGKKGNELDQTIDNLISAQKDAQEKQAALTAPVVKASKVMSKITTPGTPEAQKFDEKLAAMPEVQAYERQQKRVEKAQQEVDDAEEALSN